ncbi:hypothetical protein F511_05275 [Dorcoceras hygrometricum]|uniref:Uncharacterized protein n=1 Tax=Dorcoceras hygrometricum TaxID=472368 RepID=A0A2Z7AKJ8_9LAMI|nr:hypothetical protein F511_05275 [Dorcoceras hygrometricum]
MFGLHFRVENRIWSISGKFEIFEILVKSSNRFDDVSVVGMRCDADVNIAGLRDLSVKSVSGFDDVRIAWLLSVDDIWLRSVQRASYGATPFSERGRRDLFCLVGVRKFRPDDISPVRRRSGIFVGLALVYSILRDISLDFVLCFLKPLSLFTVNFSGHFPLTPATVFHIQGSVRFLLKSSFILYRSWKLRVVQGEIVGRQKLIPVRVLCAQVAFEF